MDERKVCVVGQRIFHLDVSRVAGSNARICSSDPNARGTHARWCWWSGCDGSRTGASRGIGKGIALALGEQGATVYVTGRTTGSGERTIDTTARQITEKGGKGIAIQCDHAVDAQIAKVFEQVGREAGHIDFLVNNVYKIPSPPAWGGGFWDHPIQMINRTLRNTSRVARNAVSEGVVRIQQDSTKTIEDVRELVAGVRGRANVLGAGDIDGGIWTVGQSQGLSHDIPSCNELVSRIMAQAESIIHQRLDRMAS